MTHECAREEQVRQAVLSGRWPQQADQELTAHVTHCDICSDVAVVALALRVDHEEARRDVHVPAAGQVWWRAAVRARLETTQAATQPMTWLHGLSGAMAIGVALAAIGMAWPSLGIAVGWTKTMIADLIPQTTVAAGVFDALRQSFIVAVVAGACLVLAPLALYFALSDD